MASYVAVITQNFWWRGSLLHLGTIVGCGMLLVGAIDTKCGLLIIDEFEGRTIEVPATLDMLEYGPNPGGYIGLVVDTYIGGDICVLK